MFLAGKNATAILMVILPCMMLAACASQVMKSYVGAPIDLVMIDNGPAAHIYELGGNQGGNQRAYQWRKQEFQAVPGTSAGEVRHTARGERYRSITTPGYIESTECFYTYYANRSSNTWYVTGYRAPSLECE